MPAAERGTAIAAARAWFGVQALAGAAWWVAVAASSTVRWWTLGRWDPAVLAVPDLLLFVGGSGVVALTGNRVVAVVVSTWTSVVAVVLGVYALVEQMAPWGAVLMAVSAVVTLASASTLWFGYLPTGWFFVGPFSFRVADEASDRHHLLRSMAQLIVFWTTFFVLVPIVLTAVEVRLGLHPAGLDQGWVRATGAALFALGSAVGVWSCVTMATRGHGTPLPAETARDLVVTGPYLWVRNPMALAGVAQTVGVGLWLGSWMVIAIAFAGAVVWDAVIRPTEEADLVERFGEPYEHYAERVRCWIPRWPQAGR
jgi:protein-S-isoprenylcysteine O-methyltransferase Ste14